jgi:hypothetical protein
MTCVHFMKQTNDAVQYKLSIHCLCDGKENSGGFYIIISNKVFDFDK